MIGEAPTVQFVLGNHATHWRDIESLDASDIARLPHRFVGGRNSWIAQTYVRLRRALEARGWKVRVGARFVPGAIAIVHRDDANDFLGNAHASFLVVVRADRPPVRACDFALVQNELSLSPLERFLPLWPQPGLLPRAAERGTRVERLAYHGRHVPAWFADARFARCLQQRGIRFEVKRSGWEDYQFVDVALASREDAAAVLATKPASKLYNAWLAGVPALASPEPAYRELRRSPIDYIEIGNPRDVLRALDLLRANPRLYSAMVANGLVRGREFALEAIRDRWLDFLEIEVWPAFSASRDRLSRRRAWHVSAMAAQKTLSRVHRIRAAVQRWKIGATLREPLAESASDHFADVARQAL